jgi:hypothetical protein
MACCAFVAFLISQLCLIVRALVRWVRGTPGAPVHSAVMWRLEGLGLQSGDVSVSHMPSARLPRRRAAALLSLAVAAELGFMMAGAYWIKHGGAQALALQAERLASIRSITDLSIICTARR